MNKSTYRLEFAEGVRCQLERLPGNVYQRFKRTIESLRTEPRPRNAERLRGAAERYKIALGDYRLVYRVQDDRLLVLVLKLGKKHGPEFYIDLDLKS